MQYALKDLKQGYAHFLGR